MLIRLKDIELRAYHGVLEEERRKGNLFRVSVTMTVPDVKGIETDQLEDTINYADIYQLVVREMQVPSQLLEHVAGRIRKAVQQNYPTATEVHISVSKQNPPVGGKVAWAEITV